MTVGSLFSGIGGLDLGFERAGFMVKWFCEADPFCRAVLAKHWPGVPCHEDVRAIGAHNVEPVDVLIGGFPCQDVSDAGLRIGLDGARSGLWREYARLIRELRHHGLRGVCVENVAGLFARGFDAVLGDLAALRFDAEWAVVRASDVRAPHRRARVFILAHAQLHAGGDEQQRLERGATGNGQESREAGARRLAHTNSRGQREPHEPRHADGSRPGKLADTDGDGRGRLRGSTGRRAHESEQRSHAVRGSEGRDMVDAARGLQCDRQEDDAAAIAGRKEQQTVTRRSGAQGLADSADNGRGERGTSHDVDRRDASGHDADGCDSPVANAKHGRREEGRELPGREAGRAADQRGEESARRLALANESELAHAHRDGYGVGGWAGIDRSRDARAEPVQGGRGAPGARGQGHRAPFWPARPGEPQHAWEPPRCLESSVGARADGVSRGLAGWRRAALQATGNAVVPQVGEVVARRLRDILERGVA